MGSRLLTRLLCIMTFACLLLAGCGGGGTASSGGGSAPGAGTVPSGLGAIPTTSLPGKTGVALDVSIKRVSAREDVRAATAEDIQEILIDFLDRETREPVVNTTVVKRNAPSVDVTIDVPVGTWILRIQGRTAAGEVAGTRFETLITVVEGETTQAEAELNPVTNLVAIQVNPGPTTLLAQGTTGQFTAVGLLSDLTTASLNVQWSSSNPAVASISATGLVTALSAGTTTISARSGNVVGTSTLTVTPTAVKSLQVTPNPLELSPGLTQQLTATAVFEDNTNQNVTGQVTWTSSAPNVASVSAAGLVTAAAPGQATLTARLGNTTATANLTVKPVLTRINLTPTNLTLPVGTSQSVRATAVFSDNTTEDITNTVTWATGNGAVATVTNTGSVTGVAPGTTTLTATSANVTATANVRVDPLQLTRLAISPPSATIPKGATQAFNVTGTFNNNTTRDVTQEVTWTSTNLGVAAVSNANGTRGEVSAVNAGSTVIEATLDGISAASSVNVTPATLVTLTISPANPTTGSGNLVVFTATGAFSDGTSINLTTNVTWTSGNVNVATISNAAGSEGNAISTAGGTTTITAAFGNVTASTSFTTTVPTPPPPAPSPSPTTPALPNVLVSYNAGNTGECVRPVDCRGKQTLNADGTLVLFVGDYFNDLTLPPPASQGIYLRDTTTNTTTRLTPDSGSDYGDPGLSADGRYVVFATPASLVAEDTNAEIDTYFIDRTAPGTIRLVSVNPATGLAAGSTDGASVSDDGRYVVFSCPVPLTAGANTERSVYRRDLSLAGTDPACQQLINVLSSGAVGATKTTADQPQISGNGRYVTFRSNDSTLAGGASAALRIYRRDTLGGPGSTALVSEDAAVGDAALPHLSSDGSIIVYQYDIGGRIEIFARDMSGATPSLVSFTHDGLPSNGNSLDPTVSGDGRYVGFSSTATNLVPGSAPPPAPKTVLHPLAPGGGSDIYVRDRSGAQGAIALITPRLAGSIQSCSGARMSRDGRGVAFTSNAPDLLPGLTLLNQNVYRFFNTLAASR